MKVLIISTNAIGDAYLSMAAIVPLQNKYPTAEFVFVFPEHARLLEECENKNFAFMFVKKKYTSLIKVISKLFFTRFDRVFSFYPGIFNSILFNVLSGEKKIGQINLIKENRWDNKNAELIVIERGNNKTKIIIDKDENFLSRISTALQITDNISGNLNKYKPIHVENNGKEVKQILIHYKASIQEKSFTLHILVELIKFLKKNTLFDIILLGTTFDFSTVDKSEISKYSINYLIEPDLKSLVFAINSSFFVGVDSFPLHIADAYNTNFVGVCSMTNPKSVLINSERSIAFNEDSFERIDTRVFINKITSYLKSNNLFKISEEHG